MGDDKNFDVLKDLSNQAVLEFEEIQAKCEDFYMKYCKQHDKNQKLEAQFKQLKRVSLLAVTEYENLLKQYTDQEKLKGAIESKLKEVEEENKELRKANRISPNISIIPVNSNQGSSDGGTKGELEGLKSLLNGMKDEIRRAKTEKSKVEKQLEDEKRDHEVTKKNLNVIHSQFNQLSRVSDLALEESQELREKYEAEVACRKKAEEYATQLVHENQNMMRKSKMMNESSAPNERLEKALQEIDDLSSKLSKERSENAKKIKDMEEEFSSSNDANAIKALESKLSVSCDQIELLQSQVQELEDRARQSEQRARDLYAKLIRTEEALASGDKTLPEFVASPPPPPPPPPPPMPAPVFRKFITRLGMGKKKKSMQEKEDKEDPIQDMMKEMMARIQKGIQLKSSKPKDEASPAMNELASLLTNLKRGQNNQARPEEVEKKNLPEFQKFKLKKVSVDRGHGKSDGLMIDSELMKKLGKQKIVAEGGDEARSDGPPAVLEKHRPSLQPEKHVQESAEVTACDTVNKTEENSVKEKIEIGADGDKEDGVSRQEDASGGERSADLITTTENYEDTNDQLDKEAVKEGSEDEADKPSGENTEAASAVGESANDDIEDAMKSMDDTFDEINKLLG